MKKCIVCNHEIQEIFSLGDLYLSNFIPLQDSSINYEKSNLTMMACPKCFTGTLKEEVNPSILYKKYWYYSGINQTMQNALKDVVDSCLSSIPVENDDIWLDIASNDNTLLKTVPKNLKRIGIDPSNIASEVKDSNITVVNNYFSKQAYWSVADKRAKIITCIAMFYDLSNPHQFLDDVRDIIQDNGLFVIQISYTPLMFKQLEFGNICAEHVMYYSFSGLKELLRQHGFKVVDCELNDINGGSFRVYCTKSNVEHFRTPQKRDVAELRMSGLTALEYHMDLFEYFKEFGLRIQDLKYQTLDFIKKEVSAGKVVYGYGASTKGNTLLQYFELDNSLITKIAERNSTKHGLKTIGTEIPICSEEEMRTDNPDYLLILPWHFIEEFKVRESEYLKKGGKFITPSPRFEVISYNETV